MKKLASISLAMIFILTSTPLSRALDATQEKKKLQRNEAQIIRLINRSHANESRLSDLRLRLEVIQRGLEVLEQNARPEKPRRRLRPVKLTESVATIETGKASYYGSKFNGRHTASGAVFDDSLLTAAHLTLPFGTKVKVTNPANGKSVEVVINDRGPHVAGRIIDLTSAAFAELDRLSRGVIDVQLEVVTQVN